MKHDSINYWLSWNETFRIVHGIRIGGVILRSTNHKPTIAELGGTNDASF